MFLFFVFICLTKIKSKFLSHFIRLRIYQHEHDIVDHFEKFNKRQKTGTNAKTNYTFMQKQINISTLFSQLGLFIYLPPMFPNNSSVVIAGDSSIRL